MAHQSLDPSSDHAHHNSATSDDIHKEGLRLYAGRWIARLGDRIVGQGGTPAQALAAAKTTRFKEIPQVSYVPTIEPLALSSKLEQIRSALPPELSVYLVGGAVRDAMMDRETHDLDFVLAGNSLGVGRHVADTLGAAFYPLDEERETARVVIIQPDRHRLILDFAVQRGPDLESDLIARDFTINAMAVDIRQPDALLDPLGGAADLRAKRLRACSPNTFIDDPLRILRGIRMAAAFGFRIQPETLQQMRVAVPLLARISSERVRDELFRVLDGSQPGTSVRALDMLGILPFVLPELLDLKDLAQSPPHVYDAWQHTLGTLNKLGILLNVLGSPHDPGEAAGFVTGLVSLRLGRYRNRITSHLDIPFNPDRSLHALLFLAALYHDVGKSQTRQEDGEGRIRFFDHEIIGAEMVAKRARDLRLSNDEIEILKKIVRHHLRPLLLTQTAKPPSRGAIYRFFRDTGEAGVDICLLSLADVWATYGTSLTQDVWNQHLDVIRTLLEGWWEHHTEMVSPPVLLNGNDLINELRIEPGPDVGKLLEKIREGQALGNIQNREDALVLAGEWIARSMS